jgi:hypothetical protein
VLVFDQDEHLDALMNVVKGETECIGFGVGSRALKAPGQCPRQRQVSTGIALLLYREALAKHMVFRIYGFSNAW